MADTTIGARLEADDQISPKVKNIKAELKLAQQEVIHLTEKFGATSVEVTNAAKHAAELKEKIQDSTKLINAFNPETKFHAFGASIQTVVGGFTALTGAMGLLGVQSEEVQKTLLKVQSALAISQGIAQLQEGIKSFQNLALVIKSALGPMGLIVTAIAAIAAGLALWFNRSKDVTAAQKALNDTTKDYERAAAGAIENVNKVRVAFVLARTGVISKDEALKTYNNTIGDTFGKTNDLATAEKNLLAKADDYIKITGLKAQANALFALAAQKSAEALITSIKTEGGTVGGVVKEGLILVDETRKKKDELLKDSAEIQTLGAGLLKQVAEIQKSSGLTTGKETPKVEAHKAENEKILKHETDFQLIYNAILQEQNLKIIADKEKQIEDIDSLDIQQTDLAKIQSGIRSQNDQDEHDKKMALKQAEYDATVAFANLSIDIFNSLSDIVGKNTAAGKVLAIAAIATNMAIGFMQGLVIAQKSASATGPAAAFAFPIFYATQIAAVLAAVAKAKAALGGSGPSFSAPHVAAVGAVSAPLSPQRAQAQTTQLDQQSLNAIGNATTRAFVLDADIQNNRERITRLNRAARL